MESRGPPRAVASFALAVHSSAAFVNMSIAAASTGDASTVTATAAGAGTGRSGDAAAARDPFRRPPPRRAPRCGRGGCAGLAGPQGGGWAGRYMITGQSQRRNSGTHACIAGDMTESHVSRTNIAVRCSMLCARRAPGSGAGARVWWTAGLRVAGGWPTVDSAFAAAHCALHAACSDVAMNSRQPLRTWFWGPAALWVCSNRAIAVWASRGRVHFAASCADERSCEGDPPGCVGNSAGTSCILHTCAPRAERRHVARRYSVQLDVHSLTRPDAVVHFTA